MQDYFNLYYLDEYRRKLRTIKQDARIIERINPRTLRLRLEYMQYSSHIIGVGYLTKYTQMILTLLSIGSMPYPCCAMPNPRYHTNNKNYNNKMIMTNPIYYKEL